MHNKSGFPRILFTAMIIFWLLPSVTAQESMVEQPLFPVTSSGTGWINLDDTPAPTPPPAWAFGGRSAISFSQLSLVNWAAGGENSYSLAGMIQLYGKYKKEKTDWSNTLDLGYGVVKQAQLQVRKSDDKIDFMSKFGYLAINRWHYSAMINFKSQMAKGYLYENNGDRKMISDFMSPGYLLVSLGMEYKSKNDAFYLLISPFTGKSTFVYNDSMSAAGAYGLEPGTNVRQEFGGFTKIAYAKEVFKNVNLAMKCDLFSNYLQKPQNIDINMETIIMMKVNKFLVTSISMNLIYDDDINITDSEGNTGPRTQFKEVLAIGLSYSFGK